LPVQLGELDLGEVPTPHRPSRRPARRPTHSPTSAAPRHRPTVNFPRRRGKRREVPRYCSATIDARASVLATTEACAATVTTHDHQPPDTDVCAVRGPRCAAGSARCRAGGCWGGGRGGVVVAAGGAGFGDQDPGGGEPLGGGARLAGEDLEEVVGGGRSSP